MLSGGLENLIKGFQQSGQGRTAQSWVNRGANEDIAPGDLESALGSDTIDALSQQTGMGRGELLSGLSQQLPHFVDQLTPDGRLPTEDEAQRFDPVTGRFRYKLDPATHQPMVSLDRTLDPSSPTNIRCEDNRACVKLRAYRALIDYARDTAARLGFGEPGHAP